MNNITNIENELTNIDDYVGAIIFIIVVMLWYSLSIVFLFGMQMIGPSERFENVLEYSNELFTQNFREKTKHQKILEELGDKGTRDKLWDIYFGRSSDVNDKVTLAEPLRIRNIQRRLSTINEFYRDNYEKVQYLNIENNLSRSNLSTGTPSRSPFNNRFRTRRQSSVN